jgi:MoxR-like ATPase
MATQNPIEQEGTYSLPETQMDRFLIQVQVGYADEKCRKARSSGSCEARRRTRRKRRRRRSGDDKIVEEVAVA